MEQIPIVKTSQVPNRTLDIHLSSVVQNAEALEALFGQAGIGDPTDNPHVADIRNHTVLVFGDLLTGEHV